MLAAGGTRVTLEAKGAAGGGVLFAQASYNGKSLVPAGRALPKIEFDTVTGQRILQMTFTFSAGIPGRGTLVEDCGAGASQAIRELFGDEPAQFLEVVGS